VSRQASGAQEIPNSDLCAPTTSYFVQPSADDGLAPLLRLNVVMRIVSVKPCR
jgi:hypothetical protein